MTWKYQRLKGAYSIALAHGIGEGPQLLTFKAEVNSASLFDIVDLSLITSDIEREGLNRAAL